MGQLMKKEWGQLSCNLGLILRPTLPNNDVRPRGGMKVGVPPPARLLPRP